MALRVGEAKGQCTFRVHVVPRGRYDEIAGLYGDALRVRLKAAPVEGAANRALQKFLAERLGVGVGAVAIVAGHASRHKLVQVSGVSTAQILSLLGPSASDSSA